MITPDDADRAMEQQLEGWLAKKCPPPIPAAAPEIAIPASVPLPVGPWLTIKQACVEAAVTRRTIYNWLNAGKLRTRRTVGGHLRIDPASLFVESEAAVAAETRRAGT